MQSKIFQAENEDKEEERFELLEFAQNYFNEHEKSPNGTIVGTLKRSKTIEMLSKTDMISYYKGNSIPNSHIHMFDPENVNIACNIFKDLIKYTKGKFFYCEYAIGTSNHCSWFEELICFYLFQIKRHFLIFTMLISVVEFQAQIRDTFPIWIFNLGPF